MTRCKFLFFCLCVFIFFNSAAWAGEVSPLTEKDRILVLAPHPDDETIGAGGLLQDAAHRGLPVRVVYLTNGDSNEWAFLVSEKRLVFKRSGVIHMGGVRQKEAAAAMALIGIPKEQLIFLGYPDAGTLNIFTQYWGVTQPYRSLLTRVTRVPYKNGFSTGAPYVGESILRDLERILLDFKPTRIFVSHPLDNNPDHRAFYLFLCVALWDLEKKIPQPEIYPYLVHEAHWPAPGGFDPELRLEPPERLKTTDIAWNFFDLSPVQIQKKKEALDFYSTQIQYSAAYLYSFARRNELFGDYPVLVLKENEEELMDWQAIESKQNIRGEPVDEDESGEQFLESLAYAVKDGFLYVKVNPRAWTDKWLGINLHLLGYKKGLPFSYMPKYRLKISFGRRVTVYEKGRRVFIRDMKVERAGKAVVVKFPLASLESPHYILSSTRTHLKEVPVDRTAWRILRIEGAPAQKILMK